MLDPTDQRPTVSDRVHRFRLTQDEARNLHDPMGDGGHQHFIRKMLSRLDSETGQIVIDDGDLGKLVRYMTGYGSGGFQYRLRRAFGRSLRQMMGV